MIQTHAVGQSCKEFKNLSVLHGLWDDDVGSQIEEGVSRMARYTDSTAMYEVEAPSWTLHTGHRDIDNLNIPGLAVS